MTEDWRNAFGILMCTEICDRAGVGIWDGVPSTCSSFKINFKKKKSPQEYHQSFKQFRSRSGPTCLGLIWVQTVCKGYQQMTKVATCWERVSPCPAEPGYILPLQTV